MKKQKIFSLLALALVMPLAGCLGALNPADEVIGRWSTSQASCINPIEFKPLGVASIAIPSAGTIDGNWTRSNGSIVLSKVAVGNALLGVKVKLVLSEPNNNQMTIKSANVTGVGGVDLSRFLSGYDKVYKCK